MSDLEIPAAIGEITREEPVWEATYIADLDNRIHQVGRLTTKSAELVFFERVAEGKDVEHLSNVEYAEPRVLTHHEALNKRYQFDAQWPARPILRGAILGLWNQGRLHEYDGGVGGIFDVSDDIDSDKPSYTLRVDADGALSVRIDNPHILDDNEPVLWHQYTLPRGTSRGIHRVKTANGSTVERTIINASHIVSYVKAGVNMASKLADRQAA